MIVVYHVVKLKITSQQTSWIQNALRKICQNTGFLWPAFSCMRTELKLLSLYGKMRVSENPHSGIFYAVMISVICKRLPVNISNLLKMFTGKKIPKNCLCCVSQLISLPNSQLFHFFLKGLVNNLRSQTAMRSHQSFMFATAYSLRILLFDWPH